MWESFLSSLLDFIAPPRQTEKLVRALSLDNLQKLTLQRGQAGILPYHDERVRALIWELKYYANKQAAALGAAVLHETLIAVASEQLGTPLLIPVPMHKTRKRMRGHNQTEVLCEALLPYIHEYFDYVPKVLMRSKNTLQQQGLEKHVRLLNLAGSMEVVESEKVLGRVCVLLDDVSTTGATFKEATRALKAAGARHVECIALAQS
jgi:ComF family protein